MARLSRYGAKAWLDGVRRLDAPFAALGSIRRRAALASAAWAVVVAAYAIGFFGASQARGTAFLDSAFFLVALVLPVMLIWIAAYLAEELVRQRDMIAGLAELAGPLTGALAATRDTLERHGPASPAEIARAVQGAVFAGRGDAGPALERVLAGQAQIEAALRALSARPPAVAQDAVGQDVGAAGRAEAGRPPSPASAASDNAAASVTPRPASVRRPAPAAASGGPADAAAGQASSQPDLPTLAEAQPETRLEWGELMRALDFPRDAEDREGFRALRLALRRRNLAQMLQAAEDVLTLLSQEGVYMDDLAGPPADADAWRRFIAGERGARVAAMGAVTEKGALETARGLMKSDPIFRDTALFFQRRFDAVLSEIAGGADDAELAQLADTRSGRAFQLMARASGSFD